MKTNLLQTRSIIWPPQVKYALWIFSIAFFAVGIYLITSALTFRLGFPLDDAWIHQTYARNLALYGQWAFIPGQVSAGSTAPLWTLLLVPGYWLGKGHFIWTIFLGALSIGMLAFLAENILRGQIPGSKMTVPILGIFLAAEWHLVWAASSGMETAFFAFVIMLVFYLLSKSDGNAYVIGLISGLAVWIRPDGITLLGPVLFVLFFSGKQTNQKVKGILFSLLGALTSVLPYLAFNYFISGHFLPNTFFAKQAEYAILRELPFAQRFFSLFSLPLVGAGALLLPGFLWGLWMCIKKKNWLLLSAALWWGGYTLIYVLRLPVVYQHGRYLIPAMPLFFLIGLYGTMDFVTLYRSRNRLLRISVNTLLISLACVWLGFFYLGAKIYAQDVAIIESEMVDTGKWIATNLDGDALIAVHDIGAIGYFGGHPLVDLAGLVNPEVIPFIRNESELAEYMNAKSVDYLVTFPEWYPELVKEGELVYFQTQGQFSVSAGGENMCVYIWKGK